MNNFIRGFTTGSAEALLGALATQRFSGTLALYKHPGWLLAFIVSGETEQLARFGKYPGVHVTGQHFVQFAHDIQSTPELPAVANWPAFPATATWPTSLLPLPVALRNLGAVAGVLTLANADESSALVHRGQLLLARDSTGSMHVNTFTARYGNAASATFAPLPQDIHEALRTADPPEVFTRGASTVLTVSGMHETEPPAPLAPEPAQEPMPRKAPEAAPAQALVPEAKVTYRVTLRGRDALDPMSDRASEFRAAFGPAATEVLRAIAAGRAASAPDNVVSELVAGGYIYIPEDA